MNDHASQAETTPRFWVSHHFQTTCIAHLPKPGSGAWWAGSWRAMSDAEMEGFAEASGHPPACDACIAIAEMATTASPTHAEQRDATVVQLARSLGVDHLEARGNDDMDHNEVHVDLLREALEEAFEAGRASALPGMGAIG